MKEGIQNCVEMKGVNNDAKVGWGPRVGPNVSKKCQGISTDDYSVKGLTQVPGGSGQL